MGGNRGIGRGRSVAEVNVSHIISIIIIFIIIIIIIIININIITIIHHHLSLPIRDDPRLIARFATGVYSPRISKLKLGKHDSFGATIHCDWLEILQRAQRLV